MKILVTVKRVIDPYVKVRVRTDGTGVETENVKMAMNPFCENAVEQALQWKEAGLANEVIAMSIGPENVQDTLRTALAMGADRAVWVACDSTPEPLGAAKAIAEVAKREQPGVIWMGKQGIDSDFNQTGQMAAALLGWGQALFVSKASIDGDSITAESEVDSGIQVVQIKMPCVLTADLRLNEARFATLPNIMKAKRKQIDRIDPNDLGIDISRRLETIEVTEPPPRGGGRKVADVTELVSLLRNEAKVIA